jgi:Zn finger protein HypA/HybF involved in hydrogenase expression
MKNKNPNRQQCDFCGHQLINKTVLFAKCPTCKAPSPFRWIESDLIKLNLSPKKN